MIKAVLLAAGASTRFGSENKLLTTKKNNKPLFLYGAEALLASSELTCAVVTGYTEIKESLSSRMDVIWNPSPEKGASHSVKLAIEWAKDAEACLFLVADQPNITPETIKNFLADWRSSRQPLGCVWDGKNLSNPCIFSSSYFPHLLSLSGDRGGKKVIIDHPTDCYLYLTAPAELIDIDTTSDLELLCTSDN